MHDIKIHYLKMVLITTKVKAVHYSDCVSHLFHHQLKSLIDRVFTRTIPAGLSARLDTPLVLKLGDIPGAFFEPFFCRRLESVLEQTLRQLLVEMPELWTHDSPAQCREILIQALRSTEEPAETWLWRQLEMAPDIWWPVLAGFTLLPEGSALYYKLSGETLRSLCNQLAADVPQQGRFTEDSLWLSALHYFQRNPELPLPQEAVNTIARGLRVEQSTRSENSYDLRLIKALFEHPLSPSTPLTPWLRVLWQNPRVVAHIQPLLPAEQVTQLHKQLSGKNIQTQQSQPRNRKSGFPSEEQWQPVNCAGLVLLWPMLPGLFRQQGLVEGKRFVSPQAQQQAAACLDWLSCAGDNSETWQCSKVSLLLCGLATETQVAAEWPDDNQQQILQQWLAQLPHLLPGTWQKLSPTDIRMWFLQRPGWLPAEPEENILYVKPEVFDVLLNDWPWPVNLAALPWLEQPITVRWSEKE